MGVFPTFRSIFTGYVSINIIIKALFIFGVFIVLRKFITKTIIKLLKSAFDKINWKGVSLVLDSIEEPLKTFFLFSGIYFALIILPLYAQFSILLLKLYRCIIILTVARCLLKIEDSYIILQERLDKESIPSMKTLGPIIAKIIKVLIIIIALTAIAKEFDFPLNSVLAGLGIGGLAVAMAAQEVIKNFFGGFVILTDNPFSVGDIIKVDSIEGVVEVVGLRSTRVRTFEKELITVPNSKFSDGAVTNFSRRGLRRAKFHVGATYSTTADKLKNTVDKIQIMLQEHKQVDSDSTLVKFDGFGGSSLDVLVMYFIKTPDYVEYMGIKEEINFNIMKIFEEENVEFAYPSMSIYMEN